MTIDEIKTRLAHIEAMLDEIENKIKNITED